MRVKLAVNKHMMSATHDRTGDNSRTTSGGRLGGFVTIRPLISGQTSTTTILQAVSEATAKILLRVNWNHCSVQFQFKLRRLLVLVLLIIL